MTIYRRSTLHVLVAASLGLATAQALAAGDPTPAWLTRTWQTDEGLPDNSVTGIEQTADGFLWVATLGGLMRFDGERFEEFSVAHLPKVINRNIRKTLLDRQGNFWLAMDRGALVRIERKSARVFTGEDGLADSRVVAMADDGVGALWMVVGNSICRVTGEKFERVGGEAGLPTGGTPWVAAAGKGEVWLARGNQLGIVRDGRWQPAWSFDAGPLRFIAARRSGVWICAGSQVMKAVQGQSPVLVGRLPARAEVRVLMEDNEERLWVGAAADGLLVQQGGNFVPVPVSHPEIFDLKQDGEGNIWVGTSGGGLNQLRPQAFSLFSTKSGLPFDSVRSVCEDADGWVWAALQNGGLARGRGSDWAAVSVKDGWPGGNVQCVTRARDGGVWLGTRDRGLQRWKDGQSREWSRRDGLGSTWVRAALQTSQGDLWLATDQPRQLGLFDGKEFQRFEVPEGTRNLRALAETADGVLWAGTSDGQLLRLAGSRLVNETLVEADGSHSIRCLHATADGSLWIGFAGWGVGRLRGDQFARVSTGQGLSDGYVYQILSDGRDGFWITGSRGLFQVSQAALVNVLEARAEWVRSIAYGRSEGLPSVQSVCENTPTSWRGSDGQMWFATRKGVMMVSPDKICNNPTPPPVKLTRVSVDDRVVALYESQSPLRLPGESNVVDLAALPAELKVGPAHEKLEFGFTALSFSSPENVHFRYRLNGFDQEWVEAGAQRSTRYPRLPAGQYEFRVTACNEAGVWSAEGTALAFVVPPFFWQTWWFRGGVLALFTGSVVGLVRYFSFHRLRRDVERLERQAELQRERTRIARDMHDEVGAKLSRLSLLSEMAGQQGALPPAARGEVQEIAETARETIRSFEEIVWAVNPKNDSLADLVHYLCRFAEDFFEGSATQCVFDLPAETPAINLSTETRHHVFLAAKEALNNALKHARAGRVTVRLRLQNPGIEIQIEDDGVGFDPAAAAYSKGGNGLGNMRERMRLAQGQIELRSASGQGTCVSFRLNLGAANKV